MDKLQQNGVFDSDDLAMRDIKEKFAIVLVHNATNPQMRYARQNISDYKDRFADKKIQNKAALNASVTYFVNVLKVIRFLHKKFGQMKIGRLSHAWTQPVRICV